MWGMDLYPDATFRVDLCDILGGGCCSWVVRGGGGVSVAVGQFVVSAVAGVEEGGCSWGWGFEFHRVGVHC